jgi:hypothetical protein
MLVVISEAIRVLLMTNLDGLELMCSNIKLNQWLAGYIDGDGYLN